MKRSLPILDVAVLLIGLIITFTACQSKTADSYLSPPMDTTGLAQFQSWKAANDAKQATDDYTKGYKDAMAAKTVTRTKVVYKPVPAPASQPAKKKGWSSAAKGTAIGTATGALAGALLDKKNRLVGGIIGGLLGGGAGYGIGHGIDKNNGR